MAKRRQLRDDVLVQSDLTRDGPEALDGLGQRPVIEFVEVGDAKAAHLPLAPAVPRITTGAVDAHVLMEQQRSQSERDNSIGFAVVRCGHRLGVGHGPRSYRHVSSSTVAAITDERSTRTLGIRFQRGAEYRYFSVPETVYLELRSADSKGRYFNARIRDAGYTFQRVH